jgi:hypothetical protein
LSVVGYDRVTESGYFRAKITQEKLVRRDLAARNDPRQVVTDSPARYCGVEVSERTLIPGDDAQLSETPVEDWLTQTTGQIAATSGWGGGAQSLSVFREASLNDRQPHLRLGRHL